MQQNNQNSLSPRDMELIAENARLKKSRALQEKKIARSSFIDKKRKKESYKKTLLSIQKEMPLINRLLSKLLHFSPVDSLTNIFASTLFRPNPIAIGSIFAFLGMSFCYFFAKQYAYSLSGSEFALFFISGWFIGIVFDLFSAMLYKKQ